MITINLNDLEKNILLGALDVALRQVGLSACQDIAKIHNILNLAEEIEENKDVDTSNA